jgi:hypothetical protein
LLSDGSFEVRAIGIEPSTEFPPAAPSTDRSLHQPSLLGASRLSVEPSTPAIRWWSASSTSTITFEVVEGLAKGGNA